MPTSFINQKKYLHVLWWIFLVLISSCKTSSKQLKENHFSALPNEDSRMVRITSHYNKDSLILLFLTYLPKAHFEIASVRSQVILTEPKLRSNIYYKYRIEVSDGQAIVSGKYQTLGSTGNKPLSSESFWIVINFGQGGVINARGIEDVEIISDAINDAVLSYHK